MEAAGGSSGEWREARSDRQIGPWVLAGACVVLLAGVWLDQVPPVVSALVIGPWAAARVLWAQWRLRRLP